MVWCGSRAGLGPPLGIVAALVVLATVSGCTQPAPRNIDDSCAIFAEYHSWFRAAERSERRWGVPIGVQLAIIHQESRFDAKAKAPRGRFLWVLPGRRLSSSYGYTQAVKPTWSEYIRSTGNHGADRDNFSDAIDFVGWYTNRSAQRLGLRRNDAFRLYLAYHEGDEGFRRGTHNSKAWLLGVADKVSKRAGRYQSRLATCRKRLQRPWWNPF